ncbi:MAG: ankyrin repeat domain-containing protein, partial [Actinomycetota bacterium]
MLNGSELLQAVYDSPPDVVENLQAKGADPNEGDAWGYTPLMSAVTRGDPRVVRLLLRAGADARRRDVDGWPVESKPVIVA